jgi:hypothetical protein
MFKDRFWITLVGLCLIFFWFVPWRFQTNDDVLMMWLISGAYTGTPESYAVFIHPLLSSVLSWCYLLFPEIRWYGLFCYISVGLSSLLLLKGIENSQSDQNWKLFWRVFIIAISIHLCAFPQFTLVAGYLALSGIWVLFEQENPHIRFKVLAGIVLILGMLFRWESAVLVTLGWAGYVIIPSSKNVRGRINQALILGLGLLVVFGTKKLYERIWVDAEFLEFNKARAKVSDHPILVREYFSDQIPVHSDWYYFGRWMFEELPLGTKELIKKKEELDQSFSRWEEFPESLTRLMKVQLTELFKSMLILMLLIGFILTRISWKRKIAFLVLWVMFFLVFNYFNLLLGRVTFLFFLILLFPILTQTFASRYSQFWKYSTLLILVFVCVHISNFMAEAKGRKVLSKEIESLLNQKPDGNPVFLEGFFEYNYTNTFSRKRPVPTLSYGWISRSNFQRKAYQLRGFENQKGLKKFSLIAVKMPEPLVFPSYMNRISPGFKVAKQSETQNLIRLDMEKE